MSYEKESTSLPGFCSGSYIEAKKIFATKATIAVPMLGILVAFRPTLSSSRLPPPPILARSQKPVQPHYSGFASPARNVSQRKLSSDQSGHQKVAAPAYLPRPCPPDAAP